MEADDLETTENLDDNDDLVSDTTPAVKSASVPAAAPAPGTAAAPRAKKKKKRQNKDGSSKASGADGEPRKKKSKKTQRAPASDPQAAAQQVVNEQMRRVLEEDRYSAAGSIVEEPDSDAEDYLYRGQPVRLDRAALQQAMKKYMAREQRLFRLEEETAAPSSKASDASSTALPASQRSKKKGKKKGDDKTAWGPATTTALSPTRRAEQDPLLDDDVDLDRDGGSIFGQTTGSSNATWVECDKCKKWRRLRGVVDEKKLPKQWFCSMNKSDPERSRCSAPEEEYNDTVQAQSPESLADMKARKHLRVWVRRLQCNEAYESRQPTQTRGKKRATSSSAKDPYEWVRCCNPACGKWRAILRFMDAKGSVMDRTRDGEWYCVMNTWDEKMASCAAPQENLPAIGCPPWVLQDE